LCQEIINAFKITVFYLETGTVFSLSAVVVAKESTSKAALSEEERHNCRDLECEDRQCMGPSSISPLLR
jgi:hypothetical protein